MTTLLTRWKSLRAPAPAATVDPSAASAAALAAQDQLEQERCRTHQVQRVSASLRDLRERNHFADLWVDAARPRSAPSP